MAFFAYIHCKPDGAPFYVGKGTRRRAFYMGGRNPHHRAVVSKYGAKEVLVATMECSSERVAFELERGIIRCLRRSGAGLANFTAGGEGGSNPCAETRAKLSVAAKKRGVSSACRAACVKAKTGVPISATQKEKLRVASTGRIFSDTHRANISKSAKLRGVSRGVIEKARQANTGRRHSEEERRKRGMAVSAALRRSGRTVRVKANGVIYMTAAEAARAISASPSAMTLALQGSGVVKGVRVERMYGI